MDFFARQAATRRQSRWMVFLFLVAVVAIVIAIDFVVVTTVAILSVKDDGGLLASQDMSLTRYPLVIAFTTIVVLGVIGISSVARTVSLAAGGGKVAEQLGGTRVGADTTDLLKKRLRNVVEEMAIASGVPVPQVYVLEREAGINAFAAGYSPANAAITVTRGALVNLNRDELQGVIAHEFSHVLNGDMRISTRLIGLLFGLTVIAMIARTILRFGPRSGGEPQGRRRDCRDLRGGARRARARLDRALLRPPDPGGGVAQPRVARGRLRGAVHARPEWPSQRAGEDRGARDRLAVLGRRRGGGCAPPVRRGHPARLRDAPAAPRAHPRARPELPAVRVRGRPSPDERGARDGGGGGHGAHEPASGSREPVAAGRRRARAGSGRAARRESRHGSHAVQAQEVLASLPASFERAARQPAQSAALFIALAIDVAPEARELQLAYVREQFGGEFHDAVKAMLAEVDALAPVQRMPALLQVFAALSQLGRAERVDLLRCLNGLLMRENRTSAFAYALRKLAQMQLQDNLDPRRRAAGYLSAQGARDDLQVLFSALAMQGTEDEQAARSAYEAGMEVLLPGMHPTFARLGHWPPRLDQALTRIDRLQPAAKSLLVKALVLTIAHDGRMTVSESELLRAICAVLHCPLPPLYQGDVHLAQAG